MRIRFSWLAAAALLLGFFVAMPDEGSAATKKTGGGSFKWDLATAKAGRASNPGNPVTPPSPVSDFTYDLAEAHFGPVSSPGPVLPSSPELGLLDIDSTGAARAVSQDIFYTGSPAAFPAISSYHLTMNFTAPNSSVRGTTEALHVTHDPAAPGQDDRSYWQASVDMAMPGGVDYPYTFIIEANPDQPGLSLISVQTAQAPMFTPVASSFFDVFVELNFDGSTPIDSSKPLLWLTSSAVPEPATTSLLLMSGAMLMRRWRM